MSKFCSNCGQSMSDDAAFCGLCGAVVENNNATSSSPQVQPAPSLQETVAQTVTVSPVANVAPPAKKRFGKKALFACFAGTMALIIGIVTLIVVLINGRPENVAKQYVKAMCNSEFVKMAKYCAVDLDGMVEFTRVKGAYTKSEFNSKLVKKELDLQKKEDQSDMREQYGKGYKIEIEIISKVEMRSKELRELKEQLENRYDHKDIDINKILNISKIKAGMTIKARVNITGPKDSKSEKLDICCIKIGSQWRVLDYSLFGAISGIPLEMDLE